MDSHSKKRNLKGGKVSRKKVRAQVEKSQTDLLKKIDALADEHTFSRRVLDQSNSVISFFKPLFDDTDQIVDFEIEYVNSRLKDETNETVNKIIGEKMSNYYPANFENGVFEELVGCYENNEAREFQKKYTFDDVDMWYASRALRMDDGVLIFSKNITKEKEFEIELDVQNKLLSEAEYVANIGSYKWNLDQDTITYSDNAFRLFGYEPDDFEPSVEKFMSAVHPEDAPALKVAFEKVMKLKERTENRYRVITRDKKIKTIRSVSEFYKKDGHWHMVGVLVDISEQVAAEQRLRSRNLELKRTNEELESFNRIASHDLQEPLRRIQMFISRLDEEVTDKLEDREKGYLDKVGSSVERMRELIDNLLSYSRLDEVQESPVKVDLDSLLIDVKDDLSESITELEAEIVADQLPTIMGIKFQLNQLFTNLIGNSLKYTKPEVKPIIRITSEIVPHTKIDKALNLPPSRYLILRFIDNGIGFSTKYEEKIFEIFQRLHTKNEYSGTGLGLAICRKIVATHHGSIQATGTAGKGATFTVYLPYST